jgi:hypothetical protein
MLLIKISLFILIYQDKTKLLRTFRSKEFFCVEENLRVAKGYDKRPDILRELKRLKKKLEEL